MADFINYNLLLTDLQTAVQGANLGFKQVIVNAMDRDYTFSNMPLLDLRLKRAVPQPATNATYYTDIILEAEICVFDMTNRAEAAKLRDDLTNALQRFVLDHPRFNSGLTTTFVGQVDFGTGESKAEGAFVAGAVLEFHPQLYTE